MVDERNNQNIVNTAFAAGGALAYLVTGLVFETLGGAFGAVGRIREVDAIKHGVPVAVGLICFLVLFMNPKTQVWADECIAEVRKVVWPSRKDTTAMTIICCVMCIVAGIGFGLFDLFASQLIKFLVNH